MSVVAARSARAWMAERSGVPVQNPSATSAAPQRTASTKAADAADGTTWNRLYGNASYWNGNLYMAAANAPLHQYSIANGAINPVPVAVGPTATGVRGGNTVASSNPSAMICAAPFSSST